MTKPPSVCFGWGRFGAIVPVAYMGGIYWLSSIPGVPGPHTSPAGLIVLATPPSVQNLLHIPVFGLLAWLWQWSLRAWLVRTPLFYALALLLTVAYGVLDEFHQLPGARAPCIRQRHGSECLGRRRGNLAGPPVGHSVLM